MSQCISAIEKYFVLTNDQSKNSHLKWNNIFVENAFKKRSHPTACTFFDSILRLEDESPLGWKTPEQGNSYMDQTIG